MMWDSGVLLLIMCLVCMFYTGLGTYILYYIIGTTYIVYYLLMYFPPVVSNRASNYYCPGFSPSGLILLPWTDAQNFSSRKLHLSDPCGPWSRIFSNIRSLQRVLFSSSWIFLLRRSYFLLGFTWLTWWYILWCYWPSLTVMLKS